MSRPNWSATRALNGPLRGFTTPHDASRRLPTPEEAVGSENAVIAHTSTTDYGSSLIHASLIKLKERRNDLTMLKCAMLQ